MDILAKVGAAFQHLSGSLAQEAGQHSRVIVRQRKFSALTLARTFVLGFLQKPTAADEDLAQIAAQCGVALTPQAVEQRQTFRLVHFLETLFRSAVGVVVASEKSLAPILERLTVVTVLDSTTTTLPDGQRERFPGCGGSHGGGAAAMKLQVELDLKKGAITHVEIETGKTSDGGSVRQHAPRPAGSLRITDLGHFGVAAFLAIVANGAHFLSRLHYNTGVRRPDDVLVDLPPWLARQVGSWIDEPILLGPERLACRLIAWRLPQEQASRRRQKLRRETVGKYGREPSRARLAWCDWTILATSVPSRKLTPQEAAVLCRARWQVELLFKRWKSQDLADVLSGSTEVRQMVRVWARLLEAFVQHWLVAGAAWGDPVRSWNKVAETVRGFVGLLLSASGEPSLMMGVIESLRRTVASTCRRNTRKKPGTVELLNNPLNMMPMALAALDPRHGCGRASAYGMAARDRSVRESARIPASDGEGTATWPLTSLRRVLRTGCLASPRSPYGGCSARPDSPFRKPGRGARAGRPSAAARPASQMRTSVPKKWIEDSSTTAASLGLAQRSPASVGRGGTGRHRRRTPGPAVHGGYVPSSLGAVADRAGVADHLAGASAAAARAVGAE